MLIPFRKPYLTGQEKDFVGSLLEAESRGEHQDWCIKALELLGNIYGDNIFHLTNSCTSSLEIAGLLSQMGPGDEFLLPSFTFSSTANCLALRGSVPVFVDIRNDTLNIDEQLIEAAITTKTKAIIVVHYAGVSCEMDTIIQIANKYGLIVIEDAAQAIGSSYKNRPLGTMGDFGAVSFHKTKNIQCGEGGLILLKNKSNDIACSTIIDKGTNFRALAEGKIKKYRWKRLGSSYIPSDMQIAYLCGQLNSVSKITKLRRNVWQKYHELLDSAEAAGLLQRPFIPATCSSNGHIYYVLLNRDVDRAKIIEKLLSRGVQAITHYEPLHLTTVGEKLAGMKAHLPITLDINDRLVRLPLWPDMSQRQVEFVVSMLINEISSHRN